MTVRPFQTPSNELSFSGLIDNALMATGKPNQLINAVDHANAVIRECQALGLFARDMIEDALTVDTNNGYYEWTRPPLYRSMRTVKYVGLDIYPELALPGKKQKDKNYFYYAVDDYFIFKGAALGEQIAIATYYWHTPLRYFAQLGQSNTAIYPGGPYDTRRAYFDSYTMQWMYLNADGDAYVTALGDPVEEALRRRESGNWLTQDWGPLILSGTKTKIWNAAGDPRGPTEFSNYSRLQKTLQNTSSYEGEGY